MVWQQFHDHSFFSVYERNLNANFTSVSEPFRSLFFLPFLLIKKDGGVSNEIGKKRSPGIHESIRMEVMLMAIIFMLNDGEISKSKVNENGN